MEKEIDNRKMWESIRQELVNMRMVSLTKVIDCGLKSQGFTVNDSGKIVNIWPEFKIEAGKMYMCIKDLCFPETGKQFTCNKIYTSPADMQLICDNDNICHFYEPFKYYNHFRPATEEEIERHKFVQKEMGFIKGYKEKAMEMLNKIEKESGRESQRMVSAEAKEAQYNAPYRDNYNELKQVEPKDDNSEAIKLTEFEEVLKTIVNSFVQEPPQRMTNRGARNGGNTLMSIARREIAESIDMDAMVKSVDYQNNFCQHCYSNKDCLYYKARKGDVCIQLDYYKSGYERGIEDVLELIKEG